MKLFLTAAPDLTLLQIAELQYLLGGLTAPKVLVLTTAAVPYGLAEKPEWLQRTFQTLATVSRDVTEINLEEGFDRPASLTAYDLVVATGGNVFYLAYRLAITGFDQVLTQYLVAGGVYWGSSAGAVILHDDLTPFVTADDSTIVPEIKPGLGVMAKVIVPHANHPKYAPLVAEIAKAYRAKNTDMVLLNDGEALLVNQEVEQLLLK